MEYEGGRSEEDLVKYLNEKCVTERAVGGGLNEKVCVIFLSLLVFFSFFLVVFVQLFALCTLPQSFFEHSPFYTVS